MTIAEYIADQLFNHGVRFVFGIPGGPSIPYLEAFKTAGIEFILTSNEASLGLQQHLKSLRMNYLQTLYSPLMSDRIYILLDSSGKHMEKVRLS